MMENIHSEVYSTLIETYVSDRVERNKLFHAIETIPCIKRKAEWALRWITSQESFATRLFAFAIVEGLFFSGSFCAIFYMKHLGKLPGLTLSNDYIARDEGLHVEFAILLFNMLRTRLDEKLVHQIMTEAVDIEREFICEAISVRMIGMNQNMMSEYIQFTADRLLSSLGYGKIYHAKQPFDFMEQIPLEQKVNFFDRQNSVYAKANVKTN